MADIMPTSHRQVADIRPDMVQQAAQAEHKALTAGRAKSHMVEVPAMACILGRL